MTTFHAEAAAELDEAVAYYNGQRAGLGDAFADEVQATVHRIESRSELHPPLRPGVYRLQTRRFGYGVVYAVRPAGTFILAVMHLYREPGYRAGRL